MSISHFRRVVCVIFDGWTRLMGTVFDVEGAAESELRILFTLAEIDEL